MRPASDLWCFARLVNWFAPLEDGERCHQQLLELLHLSIREILCLSAATSMKAYSSGGVQLQQLFRCVDIRNEYIDVAPQQRA
jgi:hypothetical protein